MPYFFADISSLGILWKWLLPEERRGLLPPWSIYRKRWSRDCLRDVTVALNNPTLLQKYIHFPVTRAEREAVARGKFLAKNFLLNMYITACKMTYSKNLMFTLCRLMQKFRFPGVVGCIDGTHVAIVRPLQNEQIYFNRKQYHSLNVLLVSHGPLIHIICVR